MSNVVPMVSPRLQKKNPELQRLRITHERGDADPKQVICGAKGSEVTITARPGMGKTIITIKQGRDVIAFSELSWPDIVEGVGTALKGTP